MTRNRWSLRTGLTLSLTLLAFGLGACSDTPSGPDTGNPPAQMVDDFFPTSDGSSWTYVGSRPYTVTILRDTVVGGEPYKLANNSVGGNALFQVRNGDVRQRDLSGNIDVVMLKTGKPVGTTWEFDAKSPQGQTNHYLMKIEEVGAARTVEGNDYTNVTRVSMEVSLTYAGQKIVGQRANYYFAKGVGLIEYNDNVGITSLLSTYTIK